MDTTRDILFTRWVELKSHVQQRWSRISDEDLAQLDGTTEEFTNLLRQHYGYGKAQAAIEIDAWLNELDQLNQSQQ